MSNITKIHKSRGGETFTSISDDLILRTNLSLNEKALLIFIFSLPKDCILSKCYLHESLPDSKFSIDKTFSTLINKGFIKSSKIKDRKGHFIGLHYEVFQTPNSK